MAIAECNGFSGFMIPIRHVAAYADEVIEFAVDVAGPVPNPTRFAITLGQPWICWACPSLGKNFRCSGRLRGIKLCLSGHVGGGGELPFCQRQLAVLLQRGRKGRFVRMALDLPGWQVPSKLMTAVRFRSPAPAFPMALQ